MRSGGPWLPVPPPTLPLQKRDNGRKALPHSPSNQVYEAAIIQHLEVRKVLKACLSSQETAQRPRGGCWSAVIPTPVGRSHGGWGGRFLAVSLHALTAVTGGGRVCWKPGPLLCQVKEVSEVLLAVHYLHLRWQQRGYQSGSKNLSSHRPLPPTQPCNFKCLFFI